MRELFYSGQFKKDIKRYRNQPEKMERLMTILQMLKDEIPIPFEYKPHLLSGDYAGHMECHIKSDFLLIWIDTIRNLVELVRLGSHSEIFGKGAKR